MKKLLLLAGGLLLGGCTSVGSVGMVTKSMADPGSLLKNAQSFKELGPVEGEACRFFILAMVPFGDSTFSSAVDEALIKSGGDALLNVTVSSSLYGFIPIYNFFSYTCTNVKGIAIKLKQ
ncbi:TRL-like family protein [Geomonas paludis]|uniref:TRL-like family protein n=1 Tax=Geomonas paludis TaxID=2740185 RepID=A0A6V8N1Q5_9BACT|nr:hypothetical protein [Geomonas paludis]UPU36538.1 TRL-like family protein [Geomonas paludis]GFO65279.1 hypothetical protein GMPD_31980 [Geomonas paludis]